METRSNHVLVGSVVLILLAVLAIFTVWIARLGGTSEKEYDIFFRQSVDGLAKGSAVTYSGVPSGQVKEIALWRPDPQFVRVRVAVNDQTPILQGTTASISASFTGTSTISLDGARKGAPPITCPTPENRTVCPYDVPVIPTKQGGIGAILNSAPQLLERLSTLTERLTGLLSDRNQASIAGILDNTNRLTDALADRGPEIAATLAQTRVAIQQAGDAAQSIGQLAATTNGLLAEDVKPTMVNLNKAIASAQKSADTLNSAIGDARPGLQTFSKQTVPEVDRLVRDLRVMTQSLSAVAEKVDQQGAGSLIGQPQLPDYKGK
ncbi:phospholipid/cholesterol/gamma-HCH transport system substrate-binding protein [Sphingomonas sp. SORGH_AS 950]|jgi:phospholipid/cholesterol/gamma-HCH transport system substrate-binding protein|uniref:MlaD family protein n=1 Tax=unclassified Sphingomonas TaxID=196159 RepID=UPI00278041EC|nr:MULTISPECIES: MlaD family protein [unclassified Sphingomonas]MDQ1157281.1 phospholipid/cholesterol/gamma-HCH transport system substrate-binding protein [Sphingomonas sp. SORGH_AS_0950]MDR6114837.1 phospholipid/cholesterol/gamma-HCH transport system substrate-binding protein [Sphingomonas sp. SORGH_AS_0789]MDR6147700.1 phospholipid/cholesterol/gamma-HCH transport system substrate-binding protein [Sphingomonas sp. SORGH_AS_0870]MDR6151490.1 phospholipid/cholesterol/gamma-HCH transport system s